MMGPGPDGPSASPRPVASPTSSEGAGLGPRLGCQWGCQCACGPAVLRVRPDWPALVGSGTSPGPGRPCRAPTFAAADDSAAPSRALRPAAAGPNALPRLGPARTALPHSESPTGCQWGQCHGPGLKAGPGLKTGPESEQGRSGPMDPPYRPVGPRHSAGTARKRRPAPPLRRAPLRHRIRPPGLTQTHGTKKTGPRATISKSSYDYTRLFC
jgi:hypothetical protein